MTMKRFLLTVGAGLMAVAMASQSFAADLPRPAYKAPIYVSAFSWTGFYVGFTAGTRRGKTSLGKTVANTGDFNIKGPLVGGTLGYNLQTGSWVWGLEADGDISFIKG